MELEEFQRWVRQFYRQRGWSEYGPFIRVGFLIEETGEVARAVRALEIGRDRPDETDRPLPELEQELVEELGDVLGNIILLANLYDVSLEEIASAHQAKLMKRYSEGEGTAVPHKEA
ncbi:MazG nucleotide pyrophosphohydrolase domain [Chlamydia abortus]|nr:MazG nucleotide pyrophosphohydrolase domain [Chlamydia abortus]